MTDRTEAEQNEQKKLMQSGPAKQIKEEKNCKTSC
jgi:hypothetical protein